MAPVSTIKEILFPATTPSTLSSELKFGARAGGLEPEPCHWNNCPRVGLGFWGEVGISPEAPGRPCGHSTLQVWEVGTSPGVPRHPWGDPHFSPKPQPNPMRVVPMTGPRFQSPSLCPRHELGTSGRQGSGRKKDLLYSRHWSCFLSLNFLLWSNLTQNSQIKGVSGVPLRPKISPPLLCQFEKSTLIHSFLIMPKCSMALLGRDLLSKLGVFITIPPLQYSLYILHADGTWMVPIPHP